MCGGKFLITKRLARSVERHLPLRDRAEMAGVSMGERNSIASCFWSSEPYLITIGSDCTITAGVKIFTHGGCSVARDRYRNFDCFGKVTIGDRVYIGTNALIMPGVSIGNRVLIAAGSVVTKSIPDNCVVGGNPAKFLHSVDDYIESNKEYNLDSKHLSSAKKRELLMNLTEDSFIKKGNIKVR
ncbi:MAG: acyltransferase [Prevotellaceae bacterium]|nr:acyltransferase [Prevotellaceae bacterium]